MTVSLLHIAIIVGIIFVAFIFILIFMLKPLDYTKKENWAYYPEENKKEADCFLIYPTVDMGKTGKLFASVKNPKYISKAIGTLKQMEGLYSDVCDIYAPFYRQSTFRVFTDYEKYSGLYNDNSYIDIRKAFVHYLKHCDPERPLYFAGFSQGSAMAYRLYRDFMQDEKVGKRLVAFYCIGWHFDDENIQKHPYFKPATCENDVGVIVAYNSEAENITSAPEGYRTYSINPLNWKTNSAFADKTLNLGACFFDTYGNKIKEIPEFCSAYIDSKTGYLKVPDVDPKEYPGKIMPDGIFHIYDYMFFYRNIQQNVKTRLEAYKRRKN